MIESVKKWPFKYGTPYPWHFSKDYSAFDEPPFLTEGETILQINSHDAYCISGNKFMFEVQNYGGVSKGLEVRISFETSGADVIDIHGITLIKLKDVHDCEWFPLNGSSVVAGDRKITVISLPDFMIPEGVNLLSAKLCGKKKQDEADLRSFSFRFIPQGDQRLMESMQIELIPMQYPAKVLVWYYREHLTAMPE
jgi:hypothetical protein